jgi:hypothetical protein
MPSLRDEMLFWSQKALDAHHNMLETIQVSAGKWQAAIAAALGLYATVGFLLGPDKLATFPVQGWPEVGALSAFAAAGAAGLGAVVLANLAAQGIPEILTGTVMTGQQFHELVTRRAISARKRLGRAIGLALVAGGLAISTSTFVLFAGVFAANHPAALLVNPTGAYCGELVSSNGALTLRLANGSTVSIAGGSLTRVNSCPQ